MLNADSTSVSAYLDELLQPAPRAPAAAAPATSPASAPGSAASVPAPAPAPAPTSTPNPAPAMPPAAPAATLAAAAPAQADARQRRASDRSERWIGFQVAGQGYAVEVLKVLEVQRVGEITPVPGASRDLMGAVNLRGQIVPVLDLGLRLGFAPLRVGEASRVVIIDYKGQPVGLCVDGVSEVVTALSSTIEPTPRLGGRVGEGWIRGVLRHRGEMVLLLDPLRLLADAEADLASVS